MLSFIKPHLELYAPASPQQTSIHNIGGVTPTVTGTANAVAMATTNQFTRTTRLQFESAAGANSNAGIRSAAQTFTMGVPGSPDYGGFRYTGIFGISDAAAVANASMFVGVRASTAAPGGGFDPSTLTDLIGMGHKAGDTTMSIYYGGSAAQTPVSLGANFPCNTRNTDMYMLELVNLSSSNNTVYYRVTRLNTGDVATGTLTGTAGTALPANTTFLNAAHAFRTNGSTALAVRIDIAGIALQAGI